ncbi:hypothetical protein A3A20_00365 [Candidatus Wolfebacteria bacterium RIFCSPLOWO2_01_FULL_45_19]|uniref:AMP-dependent synthetase/ligase domain-containing protein n=1 Tax=Candidatus Wolfebacteria bacterium RIFCSPLOWO2_01_FULL_45_19 TaxID=1802557 RepID=A0A1F8DQY6_9BACT|nr:MAG: hypothetical protein A3A20_00365 [Candidatus Wolfebacteria bacterium RIFCSPLOWO2_01_FULL_45_19]
MKQISLRELIFYVWRSSHLYRKLWESRGFDPEKDFHKDEDLKNIPVITKKELRAIDLKNRTTASTYDGPYFLGFSSGTTGFPLSVFHNSYTKPSYYRFIEKLDAGKRTSCLILRPWHMMPVFINATLKGGYFNSEARVICGDINNLEFYARLAKENEVDYLLTSPHTAIRLAAILEKKKYSISYIKSILISGSPLSSAAIQLLKQYYGDATILYAYAIAEAPAAIGLKSSLCDALNKISPNAYHLNTEDYILEINRGASVITSLRKNPTPLIRYAIEDQIILKNNFRCSCGFPNGPICIVGPRIGEEFYKIGGYSFHIEHVKYALKKLTYLFTDDFTLQLEQAVYEKQLITIPRLFLKPRKWFVKFLNKKLIAEIITKSFYINQNGKYISFKDELQKKLLQPLEINFNSTIKGRRILPASETVKPFY